MVFCLFMNQIYAREGWKTALVDAGGALGGAGSVASLCPPCPASPPWGWAAIGAGALIGGAAASCAIYPNLSIPQKQITNISLLSNPEIGIKHNEILTGYLPTVNEFSTNSYLEYIGSNSDKLGANSKFEDVELNYQSIVEESLKYHRASDEELDALIVSNFVKPEDRLVFSGMLSKIKSYETFKELDEEFLPISKSFRDKMSSDFEKYKFDIFVSIFIHSAALTN